MRCQNSSCPSVTCPQSCTAPYRVSQRQLTGDKQGELDAKDTNPTCSNVALPARHYWHRQLGMQHQQHNTWQAIEREHIELYKVSSTKKNETRTDITQVVHHLDPTEQADHTCMSLHVPSELRASICVMCQEDFKVQSFDKWPN